MLIYRICSVHFWIFGSMSVLEHFKIVQLHFEGRSLLVHRSGRGDWILFSRGLVVRRAYQLVVQVLMVMVWWARGCTLLELRSTLGSWFGHGSFAGIFAAVHLIRNWIGCGWRPHELPAVNPWVLELFYDLFLFASTFIFAIVDFFDLCFRQLGFLEFFFKVFGCILWYFWHEIACFLFVE